MSGKDIDNLNEQQIRFSHEYVKCWNGAQAARAAGYAKDSARVHASKLLSNNNVSEYIKGLMTSAGINRDSIIKMLSDAFNLDQTKLIEAVEEIQDHDKENGRTITTYKFDVNAIPEAMRKLIDVEYSPSKGAVLKSPKKLALLENIIKVLGLFAPDKHEVTVKGVASVNLPSNGRMKTE